jgi:hypothetical protein
MAGVRPFFLSGANAKIKLNGKTIAFCSDFMCSIQITHQTPKVLGMYEGVSVEPLSYNVAGSFSIIRYVHNAEANIGGVSPKGVALNDAGNGVGNWGSVWGGSALGNLPSIIGNPFSSGADGRANEALDPSKYSQGTTFDIEIYQHNPNGDPLGVYKVRSARISRADFNMSKKSPGMDKFEFVALYVDGDAYVANPSGSGQQNS